MRIDSFGATPDGHNVERITLRNGGMRAQILTLGAVLRDLRLESHPAPLVLGLNSAADYWDSPWYFGAIVGRVANRVARGHLPLNGTDHQLDRNFLAKHMLHGGRDGLHRQVWTIEAAEDASVTLGCRLADGHMGFPGALQVTCHYSLHSDNSLEITLSARADADTVCNLAPHFYFNLDDSGDLRHHRLQVQADQILETDEELVPTGKCLQLDGHPKDLRRPRAAAATALDDNYCCSQTVTPRREVAYLHSTASGIGMRLHSNQPGLQVFNAAGMRSQHTGLDGRSYGNHAGIALEPQAWPDAVHHPRFPSIILRRNARYESRNLFSFEHLAGNGAGPG